MAGVLRLESLTKGNTLRQGDLTLLKYRLFDADGDKLDISGKPATVRLMKNDFTFIAYEKEGLTVAPDDTISFSVNKILPAGLYHLEVIVDNQYIFPSRDDEGKVNVDLSTLGADVTIVEATGVEAVARKATGMMKQDEEFIDDMIANVISDTNVGNIEEYYNQFNEATTEFESLKTQALNSVTKSQNALNVANGIDAKATSALSLSESADTLSKSVQEQFNQVVIDGDSSVESAQARVNTDGVTKATLKERLDDEHTEVTTQLAQFAINVTSPPSDFVPAKGDGITDDTEAIKKIIKYGAENGRAVFFPKGVYISDKINIDEKLITQSEIENIVLIGQGAVLKRPDFSVISSWQQQLYIYANGFNITKNIIIEGITFDGNAKNNPLTTQPDGTEDNFEFQQSAQLKIMAHADNFINYIHVNNCQFYDPTADSIMLAPSASKKNIDAVNLSNLYFGARNRVRANILYGSAVRSINIVNAIADNTGTKHSRIEAEFTNSGDETTYCNISNCHFELLDSMNTMGNGDKLVVNVTNSVFEKDFYCGYVTMNVTNSVIGLKEQWTGANVSFSNCRFLLSRLEDDINDHTQLIINAGNAVERIKRAVFDNCDFDIEFLDVEVISQKSLVDVQETAIGNMNDATFTNCRFDKRAHSSLRTIGARTVRTNNCVFGGTQYGVYAGPNGASFPSNWVSQGDDFTDCAFPFFLSSHQSGWEASIKIQGGHFNDGNFIAETAISYQGFKYESSRRIVVESDPNGTMGGIVGDIAYLTQPTTGDIMWLCTTTHKETAVWKAIVTI